MVDHAQLAPTSGRRRSISDPLSAALLPPENETPTDREARLKKEEEARQRSATIDKMLKGDKERRKKKVVKILLLGQSESGKSTTLKQFQLLHTPAAFNAERVAWRFVIYLNLLRSIRRILEAITPEPDTHGFDDDDYEATETAPPIIILTNGQSSLSRSIVVSAYEAYRRHLEPLAEIEQRLIEQLSDPEDPNEQEATHLPPQSHGTPQYSMSPEGGRSQLPKISIPSGSRSSPASPTSPSSLSGNELSVRTSSWKGRFALRNMQSTKGPHSGELNGWWEDPNDPVHIINRCAPVMAQMWRDPQVRQKLAEKRLRLEESSGFYLDAIERITQKMYFPTNDDVLKARLKTTGVVEHTFTLSNRDYNGVDWKIYDVGGSRNQRQAWAPYFDDVNAIIFLAPISAFDQVLAEDVHVNRLEDSLLLWQSVVTNKLLANVNIILFLNKCDLLKTKLDSGVRLKNYMPKYGDRPNDYQSVSKYFYNKFGILHQSFTPNKDRELFIHMTSVTDTRKTHTIISNVRDFILTGNLRSSALM